MKPLPFQIVSNPGGKDGARFVCRRCDAHAVLPLVREAKAFNPEATTKRAEAAGWRVTGNQQCGTGQGRKPRPQGNPPTRTTGDPDGRCQGAAARSDPRGTDAHSPHPRYPL
jgi:hypothetical protein